MAHHAVVVHRIGLLLALHPVILRHSHRGAGNLGGADLGLIAVAHDAGIGRVGDLVGVDRMRNLGGDAPAACAVAQIIIAAAATAQEIVNLLMEFSFLLGYTGTNETKSCARRGSDAIDPNF